MKKIKIYIFLLITFFLHCCQKNSENIIKKNSIDIKSISIERKDIKSLMCIGKIKEAVKLETKDNSLIGNVDLVIRDGNGDFYVGDYYSSKKIFRFDKNGNFITCFGRIGQGPGEYKNILSFALNSDNSVVLLTSLKLIKFDRNGKLIKEVRINYFAKDITIIDDLIYIFVLRYRHSPKIKKAIIILDSDLKKVGEMSTYDTRLEKYLCLPKRIFAKSNGKLCFIDIYDLKLNIFNPKNNEIYFLSIPNENYNLDLIWKKRKLIEKDYKEIRTRIHRFNLIFGMKDRIFLKESCVEKNIYYNAWILNLEKRKAIIFPYLKICRYSDKEILPNICFNFIAGSYNKGVIGVFDSVERFNKYKRDFPALKDIEFNIEDNPILALFEFNKIE